MIRARARKNTVKVDTSVDEDTSTSQRVEDAHQASDDACCVIDAIDDVLDEVEDDAISSDSNDALDLDPKPSEEDYDLTTYEGSAQYWTDLSAWAQRNNVDLCKC